MIVKKLILCCAAIVIASPAFAQVELKTYADRDGYLDVSVEHLLAWLRSLC